MSTEGSIRDQRIEVARETRPGIFPADPSLLAYSDNNTSFEWSPSPGVEPRRGLGGPDVSEFFNGPEEHEVTVEYDLQRFPVDGAGEPLDPSGDGIVRDANNDLPNTHSLLVREENLDVPASETVNGATRKDTRLFLVGVGGRISGVSFSGDPGSQQPVVAEVTYDYAKVREYQLDQPGAETELAVVNNGSQAVDVTIEDEGAVTAETLTVAAGATEPTALTYADVDALELSEDLDGDVELYEYDATNAVVEDHLATIRGSDFYGHGEGDMGVRALGGGSHAGAIGTAYETILDDEFERPTGSSLAIEVNSVEFSVENDIESRTQVGTPRMAFSVGDRTVEASATVVGPTQSVQNAEEALGGQGGTFRWVLNGGYLDAIDARLTDFSGVSKTEGEASMSLDNTFTGETVDVTAT
jgi:hypothetical protein